jgi:hypothetical protein
MAKSAMNRDGSPVQPMTLGDMRELGVASPSFTCMQCNHRAVLDVAPWPDDVVVPWFGPRMVCTKCGTIGADARPNWKEQRRGA